MFLEMFKKCPNGGKQSKIEFPETVKKYLLENQEKTKENQRKPKKHQELHPFKKTLNSRNSGLI